MALSYLSPMATIAKKFNPLIFLIQHTLTFLMVNFTISTHALLLQAHARHPAYLPFDARSYV